MTYIVQTALNALSVGGLYAIIAIGVALVFSVMRLVNFAHASLLMLGGYVLVTLGLSKVWWWIPIILLACAAVAVVMERVAFRPLRGADQTVLLVASYSVAVIIQGLVAAAAGTRPRAVPMPTFMSGTLNFAGLSFPVVSAITIGAAILSLLLLGLLLTRTRLGLEMRAAALDLKMTQLLGVNSTMIISAAFVLSGALAAVAAFVLTAQTGNVYPTFGFNEVTIAFIACVIGGLGSLYGAAVGGLIVGVLISVLQAVLPPGVVDYRDALVYGAVILLLLLRPQGIFGKVMRTA